MSIDTGGPAYPKTCDECSHKTTSCDAEQDGMTILDRVAIEILPCLIDQECLEARQFQNAGHSKKAEEKIKDLSEKVSEVAYKIAQHMIKEKRKLERSQKND